MQQESKNPTRSETFINAFGEHRTTLLVLGLVALIFAGFSYCEPELVSPPKQAQAEQPAASHNEDQTRASIICEGDCSLHFEGVVPEHPTNQSDSKGGDEKQDASSLLNRTDLLAQERMAHWALFAAIMTGLGVVLLYATLREGNKATEYTGKSVDAYRKAERAWIGVRRVTARLGSGKDAAGNVASDVLIFRLNWINSGRTPAHRAQFYSDFAITDYLGTDVPRFEVSPTPHPRFTDMLPGAPRSSMTCVLSEAETADVLKRRKKVILYGHVAYKDTFGSDAPHETETTIEASLFGTATDPKSGELTFEFEYIGVGPQNHAT